jgi:hypothetical protein
VIKRPKKWKTNLVSHVFTYTGELAKPISEPIVAVGILGDFKLASREAEKRAKQRVAKKLDLLFGWYGIDPEAEKSWCYLAIRLALVHVPGMRVNFNSTNSRRPRSWKAGLAKSLLDDVEAVIAAKPGTQKKRGFKEAIAILHKDKLKKWHKFSLPNLVTRHREARAEARRQRRETLRMMADPSSLASNYLKLQNQARQMTTIVLEFKSDEPTKLERVLLVSV